MAKLTQPEAPAGVVSDSQWLAALVASSDDAIISKDLDSIIRSWNPGATRLFGYTAAEIIGRSVTLLIPDSRRDEEAGIVDQIRRGRRIDHFETVRQRKDGSLVDVSLTVSPIKDADGRIVGASKIARDITARKRAEQAARQSEERFRLLASHAPVGIFLSDERGGCIFVNDEWSRMAGLSLEQAQGEGWVQAVHPDDRQRVLTGWHQAVATGAASNTEFRFLRPDDSIVWLHGNAVLIEDGPTRSYLGSCINITVRKQAELQAAFLDGLRDQLEGLTDPDEIMDVTQGALAAHLGADRCYFFEIIQSENLAIVRRDWRRAGLPSTAGHHRLEDFGSPQFLALLAEPRNAIADVMSHPVTRQRTAGYEALSMRGLATSTFSKGGQRMLSLAVSTCRPRAWTDGDLDLIENVTARVWPAIERARGAQALRESERIYRAIGESIDYGVWICDAEGRGRYMSESFLRMLGLTLEQFLALDWVDTLHPDDAQATKAAWQECVREGRFWERKHRFRGADGQWHPVLARGVPLRDEAGKIQRWVGIHLDISAIEAAQAIAQKRMEALEQLNEEQRRTETMLRESETRWRQLAEAMPHLVWTCRPDGQCDYLSPQWVRYTGAPEVDQLGDGWLDFVHVDDRDRVIRDWRVAIETRSVLDHEFRIRGTDGKYRWFKTRAVPILDRKGSIVKWYGSNTDVDEFRRIEQAISQSERQLRLVTDHAPIFLAHCDREHRFKFVNRTYAERHGKKVADIVGRQVSELTGAEAYATFRQYMDECLTGHRVEFEQEIPYVTLGRRWVHVIYEPERNAGGEVIGLVAVIVDITARKQVEFELERARDDALAASRAKDDFFAALSHELRTPLSPVLLMASDAANNPALPREIREDFETIRSNISLEARLIDDLLDLTRISRGKMLLEKQPVDVHAVLRDALGNLRAEFAGKRLEVELAATDRSATVLGDPVRLQQVLWNLLKNAAKFTAENGHIRVRTRLPANRNLLLIEITDDGIGLTREELAHVFQPFAQGEHASSQSGPHRFGGLGLGLAISRNLVEMHQGHLHAQSPGRDHGATFMIELPLAPTPGSASPVAPAPGSQPAQIAPTTPSSRVLLIEDHASTRAAVQKLLSRRGMQVLVAGSVSEALTVAARETFDFVVSDVGLPDGDGYQLFTELRRLRPGLQGIAMSGYGMEEDLKRSRTAGFTAHLVKPVSIAALEKALAQLPRPGTASTPPTDGNR